ncbi:MAG: NAD(+) synthase [Myxococcales bacterium]|nr:NAD(+) synthase [Myxococcales bacterium]
MNPGHIHIAAATLNQTVGDWSGNVGRIQTAIARAQERGARLLVLPEMCIPGYSLGDRLLREGTLRRSWDALLQVAEASTGLVTLAGLPVRHEGVLYNAMAVVMDGAIHGIVAKENLAVGDVEYEGRWYQAWPAGRVLTYEGPDGTRAPMGNLMFRLGNTATFAMEICEDGWLGFRPGSRYAVAGADIIANPSASWFMVGKHAIRRQMVQQISREDHCVYVYTSLLGCDATRLVFDGSLFIAKDGAIEREGRRFVFDDDVEVADLLTDLGDIRQTRMEAGSWRQQVLDSYLGEHGPPPETIDIEGDFSSPAPARAVTPYWLPRVARSLDASLDHLADNGQLPGPPAPEDLAHLELELALCMGLRDYMRKTGARGYCLALSGGRDSGMCALLVHRMFAYDNPGLSPEALRALVHDRFVCAYLATENSSDTTRNAARAMAEECGATYIDGDVDSSVRAITAAGEQMLGHPLTWDDHDIPLQNIQARTRSVAIWLVANVYRFILLTTSNKSEASVGYSTMDGDTSGGLAPIADVPKSLIQIWLAWARRFHGLTSIDHVLKAPASAELRPQEMAQTDEDDLMPFDILDQLMYHFVQRSLEPVDIFETLWPVLAERYNGHHRAFADHIAKFVRMLCRAQWKRERFAIAFRVTAFDLDPKTGFRFPPVQKGFDEELQALYDRVAELEASA